MPDAVDIYRAVACLASAVTDGAIDVNVVSEGGGGVQPVNRSRVTTNGSIATNTVGSVTFYAPDDNTDDPTIDGVILEPGRDLSFNADIGRTLDTIAYTASATAVLEINTIAP